MHDLGLLPDRPEAFFGFDSDASYDRRDLKRAYGKAIRVYNPETHPTEFGLVRDAYERLEKSLRYGKQQSQARQIRQAWQPPASPTQTPNSPSNDATDSGSPNESLRTPSKPQPTIRQLAVADPPAALQQLKAKRQKTAQDYFLAAVLVDATAGKPTAKYLAELLEGLNAFPHDPGLVMLATEFLRTEVPDSLLVKMVSFVSENVRTPMFYQLTEPLWTRIARTHRFAEVSKLLETCESKIRQDSPETRATFYLQFLKQVIWTAPPNWTDRTLAELEARSVEMDYLAQAELELLCEVQSLLSQLGPQPASHVAKDKLLRAIRLACQSDDATNTAEVLQILHDLAGEATSLQQAFPVPGDESDRAWVSLSFQVIDQLQAFLDDSTAASPHRLAIQITHLLNDLEPNKAKLATAASRGEIRLHWLPMALIVFGSSIFGLIPVMTIAMLLPDRFTGAAILLGVVGLIAGSLWFFYRWLFPKYLRPKLADTQHRAVMKVYQQNWRHRLFRFARGSSEPWEAQLSRVQIIANKMNREDTGQTIAALVRQDAGLAIFANLQTLLR